MALGFHWPEGDRRGACQASRSELRAVLHGSPPCPQPRSSSWPVSAGCGSTPQATYFLLQAEPLQGQGFGRPYSQDMPWTQLPYIRSGRLLLVVEFVPGLIRAGSRLRSVVEVGGSCWTRAWGDSVPLACCCHVQPVLSPKSPASPVSCTDRRANLLLGVLVT